MSQMRPPRLHERELLKRRGLNPDDYLVKNHLNYVIILKHIRTGFTKYVDKRS